MDFRSALAQFNVDSDTLASAASDFAKMIDEGETPSEYWECMGTGSYKECYFIGDVAVKFALECNETILREKRVYDAALDEGLDAIFAHTIFLPLEQHLPACFVGEEDDDEDDFDCVVFQEKIADILGNNENIHAILWYDHQKSYNKYPLTGDEGENLTYTVVADLVQIFCYQEWIQAAIDCYGLKFMLDLATFCNKMRVDDLHAFNLGFRADGSPVIFDFLS
ncbi:MAG: hypothetical protein NC218_07170 [Acetobacter sp.]|nr:hypothetical protein [Acetobacter sp.]